MYLSSVAYVVDCDFSGDCIKLFLIQNEAISLSAIVVNR